MIYGPGGYNNDIFGISEVLTIVEWTMRSWNLESFRS